MINFTEFKYIIGILLQFLVTFTLAQEKLEQDIDASVLASYGFILSHHQSIDYTTNKNLVGFEILLGKKYKPDLLLKKDKARKIGLGMLFTTLGNKNSFGKLIAAYPFIKTQLCNSHKSSINAIYGVGIGLVTKPFNIHTNYKNIAISSYLNTFFSVGLNYTYKISHKYTLQSTVNLRHISNGAVKKPNKGLNFLSSTMGFTYLLNTKIIPKENLFIQNIYNPPTVTSFLLLANTGMHQISVIDGNKYFKGSIIGEFIRPVNNNWFWGIGVDYFYDTGADRKEFGEPSKKLHIRSTIGLHGSIGVILQDFNIFGNIGKSIYYKSALDSKMYSRIGIRYYISKNILANLSLKAFFFKADFIEVGFGYTIY